MNRRELLSNSVMGLLAGSDAEAAVKVPSAPRAISEESMDAIVAEVMRRIKEAEDAPLRALMEKRREASLKTGIPIEHVHGNFWIPDVCECEIEFAWDVREEIPTYIAFAGRPCPRHAHLKSLADVHATALKECQFKEDARSAALEDLRKTRPEASEDDIKWELSADGSRLLLNVDGREISMEVA